MIQPQLNFDMTLKTLNLSFLWFIERSGFQNHALQKVLETLLSTSSS